MGESSYLAARRGGRDAGCEVVHILGVGGARPQRRGVVCEGGAWWLARRWATPAGG